MSAQARVSNQAEVYQTYRDLYERLLGRREAPSQETVALYHKLVRRGSASEPPASRPVPPPVEARLGTPGGAMPINSPYYIIRPTDRLLYEAIDRADSIALIKGPRQTGKSSLLARGLFYAKQQGYQVAVTDLAAFPKAALQHEDALLPRLAVGLAESLEVDGGEWKGNLPPMVALQSWVLRLLRRDPERRIFWALDSIDDLFAQSYRDDFFGLLRSWHTNRSFQPNDPWNQLTIALVHSTEAQHFITDPNQSPFNVGTQLPLTDLTREEQETLYQIYRYPLVRASERERFRRLVGGHPYLNHRGLHAMAMERIALDTLESAANLGRSSPFHDHLVRLQHDLEAEPALGEGMSLVLRGEVSRLTDSLFYRLSSVGLLIGKSRAEAQCRCGLYENFLRRELGL